MNIKFNVVTWYSKLLSVIFFIAILPIWTFYIGMRVKEVELYTDPTGYSDSTVEELAVAKKNEHKLPKIDIGQSVLEGKAYGMVKDIFEKDGKLWVDIDPADQMSTLECVFRAYDANISQSCDSPDGLVVWNLSTSTIAMPLSEKATISVYYNDGTKIGLKPKVINTKNGKLYSFALINSGVSGTSSVSSISTTSFVASTSISTVSTPSSLTSSFAGVYNRILSYEGDDTYRWNPLMYLDITVGDAKLGEDPSKSYVNSIEEVWKP